MFSMFWSSSIIFSDKNFVKCFLPIILICLLCLCTSTFYFLKIVNLYWLLHNLQMESNVYRQFWVYKGTGTDSCFWPFGPVSKYQYPLPVLCSSSNIFLFWFQIIIAKQKPTRTFLKSLKTENLKHSYRHNWSYFFSKNMSIIFQGKTFILRFL